MIQRTACQCPGAGYCDRHKTNKGRLQWLACQRNQDLFDRWEQRLKDPDFKPEAPQPPSLPRCIHRGLEELDSVKCELCGNREVLVPVYSCTLHERCTERRFGNSSVLSRTMAACTACLDYAIETSNCLSE